MFPRPQPPFPRGAPPRMFGPRVPRGSFGPVRGMGPGTRAGAGSQMRQGGGLLAKLFGRSGNPVGGGNLIGGGNPLGVAGQSAGAATRAGTGGGGLLKALSNPTAINGFLTNTQKVLNTAQQIGPMVQQYGPLVRNLPAMWRLYKGFKDMPGDTEDEADKEDIDLTSSNDSVSGNKGKSNRKKTEHKNSTDSDIETNIESELETENEGNNLKKGRSIPKLYI